MRLFAYIYARVDPGLELVSEKPLEGSVKFPIEPIPGVVCPGVG
jgi:hypothetical protein